MTTVPSARTTADEVHELLEGIANLLVFRGKVGDVPLGEDETAVAYAVAYYGAGEPRVTRLGGRPRHLAWSCQITCAGGNDVKVLWAVDVVRGALEGVRVTNGTRSGLLHEIGDPGLPRQDRDVTPWRYLLPLDFGLYL